MAQNASSPPSSYPQKVKKDKIAGKTLGQLRDLVKVNGFIAIVLTPTGEFIISGDSRGPDNPTPAMVAFHGAKTATALSNPKEVETKRQKGPKAVSVSSQAEKQIAHLSKVAENKDLFTEPQLVAVRALAAKAPADWKQSDLEAASVLFKDLKRQFVADGIRTAADWRRFFLD
jgi:hypothetical protein